MTKTTKFSCFVSFIEKFKYEPVIVKTRSRVREEMCRDRAGAGGGGERGRGDRESFIQSRKYAHPEHMLNMVTQEMLTN